MTDFYMNNILRMPLLGLAAITLLPLAAREMTSADFRRNSVLASDRWVKIGVEESGVYEISYETLRAMGFENPEKVGLYGRGGRMLSTEFMTPSDMVINQDDLDPVGVFHKNGKLYFYGAGVEEINFINNSLYKTTGGYFNRKSRNIYSSRGYYFLTDSGEPLLMETYEPNKWAFHTHVKDGLGYVYHEKDLQQNLTYSGQLFWGEKIGTPHDRRLTWDVSMPGAKSGIKGVAMCDLYFQNMEGVSANVAYGFEEASSYFSTPYYVSGNDYYTPFKQRIAEVEVPGPKSTFFVDFDIPVQMEYSNLDYWIVTYPRTVPTMKDASGKRIAQDRILVTGMENFTPGIMTVPNPLSLEAFCITDYQKPVHLEVEKAGSTGKIRFYRSGNNPEIIVFDTELPQKQISGFSHSYTIVDNQNLHSYGQTGADFVIICAPFLKSQAEKLAEVHRRIQGISVIVATTEECYNEFSGGVPDPMAYRSLMKMLHVSPTPPKNLLLLGPLYADFRGIGVEKDPLDGIIAYQHPNCSSIRGAHNVNDFYGMMAEQLRTDYIERNNVDIGVAILPVKFESEAEALVEKIEKYMSRTDCAYYLNRFTNIGGLGDEHIHDEQVSTIQNWIRSLDNRSTILTPLSIDTYGNSEARKKLFNRFDQGMNWFTYFGHGAEQFLGKDRYFFAAGDVYKLHNEILPMAGFGGCQITNTDRGLRGLGETIVTNTPYGCIGAVVSARETWSGQNLEFFKTLFSTLFRTTSSAASDPLSKPRTVGETYAMVKSFSTYNNELAYQLVCDPAIEVPAIHRNIVIDTENLQATAGEKLTFTGYVAHFDGDRDQSFNGEIVVRLAEPAAEVACGNIETKDEPIGFNYIYADRQVAMTAADVKQGRFSVELTVPEALAIKDGKSIIYLCAYDPSTRIGAGSSASLEVNPPSGAASSESADISSPLIEEFEFNPQDCALHITVSDNYALNLSTDQLFKGLYLYVDGKECTEAATVQPSIDKTRPAYSKRVPLHALSYGTHSARIKVKDLAGNDASMEIVFTYDPVMADFTLIHCQESPGASSKFLIEGDAPSSAALVVMDAAGNEIFTKEFSGQSVEWDNCDTYGRRVAPGHYKAYIIGRGNSSSCGHSETIDVPLV